MAEFAPAVTEEAENQPLALAGVSAPPANQDPLDRLVPNSELHAAVLTKLLDMVKLSERHMGAFHTRWRSAELQYQAYLKTETMDQLRKAANQKGTPPELITITIPYTYAAVQTICTYLMHTFCGRAPMFQVASYRADMVKRAQNMESVLQYNGDHERVIRKLFQYFLDGEMYGVQILRVMWKIEARKRTIWKPTNVFGVFGQGIPQMQPVKETAVTFEGNEVRNIDPYRFYPDPRVAMDEVNQKGQFVFWEEYEGKHSLKKAEANGLVRWVDSIPARTNYPSGESNSQRGRLAGGGTSAWGDPLSDNRNGYQLLQGTVEIVPSEWGLGDSTGYEKWLFTIANRGQIIQAQPLDLDHDRHPVIVGEPYSTGYEFGNVGVTDMLSPMQEALSWLFNSHMFNVRSSLNNTFVVNPQMVDVEDLKKPAGAGRVIKLKPQAFGQDIKNAFYQVPVTDVTSGHIGDMQVLQRFADIVSSTNDTLRGVINSGGRKSATEVRTSGESSASRLASHARLISAQSMTPLAEMETINIQQLLTEPVYLKLLGQDAQEAPLRIGPEELSGDFYHPVHDGTLPLDRVALLEVWREIFTVIVSNPGLAQIFDAIGIFEYVAELGGAKNLTTFKVRTAGNEQVAQAVAAGNALPAGEAAHNFRGQHEF